MNQPPFLVQMEMTDSRPISTTVDVGTGTEGIQLNDDIARCMKILKSMNTQMAI